FIRAYTALLDSVVWTNYQWEPSVLVNTQNNSVSDSRGYRVTIGPDGQLYYAGFSDGGNTTYRFDPQDPARQLASDELISFDNYNTSFGLSGARSLNHHARYDPATGAIDRIQITLTRLSSGGGNSINVRGIAADPAGRIYMVGQAFATIANRDAQSLAGQPVGPYQGGELHLLIVSPDFQMRDTWTVFTADGGSQGSTGRAIAVRDGAIAFAADIGNSTAQMLTVAPLQAARTATDDVYLVVQKGARIFAGDFEGGTTAGWTAP
ncbi:MAG: SBBP repeat-containing protein, partial [Acidobacteriota bacterium]